MKQRNQSGFTIVELMVAATLGLLILGGAVTMFINNKRMYTEQDEMGRLQENARFAINLLVDDLRMAGHVGCSGDPLRVFNHLNNVSAGAGRAGNFNDAGGVDLTDVYSFDQTNLLEGSENGANWAPTGSAEEVGNIVAGTDGITIRFTEPSNIFPMTPTFDAAAEEFYISSNSGLQQGDVVAISDCAGVDIIQITADPTTAGCPGDRNSTDPNDVCRTTFDYTAGGVPGVTPGNLYSEFSHPYDASAKFYRLRTNRYFVGLDLNGNPVLFQKSGDDAAQPLVDGVENMQLLYGENTNGDAANIADVFVNAGGVTDWTNVVSVKIALLMRTVDEYGTRTDTATYDLLGTNVNPVDDRRRRRIFTTTVQLRNRGL